MKSVLTITFLIPLFVYAQRDWDNIQVEAQKVTHNIYFLTGAGGNIGLIIGDDGNMVIDNQFAPLSDKIKAKVAELHDAKIQYVVNTHFHGDHTGGNENLKSEGAIVVSQDNVRSRLGTTFENKLFKREITAKSESFWPTVTFSEDMTFHFNNEEINIVHVPNAHTDGDALVHFKTSNVIHTGDLFVRYGYPFVDVSAGGTINGIIAAQEKILALSDEETQIIPGHGALSNIDDVKELLAMLLKTKDIIQKAKNDGVSLEDLMAKKPLKSLHRRWSGNFINSDLFVQIVYETLDQ